jgi:hypothetical protein
MVRSGLPTTQNDHEPTPETTQRRVETNIEITATIPITVDDGLPPNTKRKGTENDTRKKVDTEIDDAIALTIATAIQATPKAAERATMIGVVESVTNLVEAAIDVKKRKSLKKRREIGRNKNTAVTEIETMPRAAEAAPLPLDRQDVLCLWGGKVKGFTCNFLQVLWENTRG